MAEICCGVVSESEASSAQCETSSRQARRRRIAFRRFKFVDFAPSDAANSRKRHQGYEAAACDIDSENAGDHDSAAASDSDKKNEKASVEVKKERLRTTWKRHGIDFELRLRTTWKRHGIDFELYPKFGVASVCGRRRDMEDAVAIQPLFHCKNNDSATVGFHYFGVYDGHGCSHVAMRCRERLHELMKEELESDEEEEWKGAMERSFTRMDKEVMKLNHSIIGANCRCELQSPECDAVGSTAVVAVVTPDKIVVSNCGDSRAVLCRNRVPVLLTSDHKPDRPDELNRIQEAGGRVIYWDGPRVLGVLAMSRAIGDNYLKPYVSCEPEVTIMDRTAEDEYLILASDGLWDVVSNDTACGVARMCLKGKGHMHAQPEGVGSTMGEGGGISDKACTDASMLLTKLALARHSSDNVSVVVVDLRRAT